MRTRSAPARSRRLTPERNCPSSGSFPPPAAASALGPMGPRRSSFCAGRPLVEWSLDVLREPCATAWWWRCRPGMSEPPDFVAGGATRSESVRAALRCRAGGRRWSWCTTRARPLVTEELVRRCIDALDGVRRRDRRCAGDATPSRRRRTAHGDPHARPRSLWAVQTPQVFRARRAASRHSTRRRPLAEATDDAAWWRRAGGKVRVVEASRRTSRSRPALRPDASRSSCCCADRLPRAPAARRRRHARRRAYFTRRERRALPRGRDRARHRGARGRRARLPLPPGARRLAAPVLEAARGRRPGRVRRVRARGDGPEAGHRGRLRSRAARTAWRACSTRTTGTTSSARSISCATRRSTCAASTTSGARRRPRQGLGALLRDARRGRPERHVRHPRPPGPREGVGRSRPRPTGDLRRFYDRAMDGDRGVRRGDRGLDRGAAQAGGRDLPRAARSSRCASRPAGRVALSSDAHTPEQLGYRYDRSRRVCCARSGVEEIAVFERRERRVEPIG